MTHDMRLVHLHAPGDIRNGRGPIPEPPAGEVRVRVAAVGVCGSDIPRMLSKGAHRMPIVCGHEVAGTVEAVGDGVSAAWLDTHVTVAPLIPCGQCDQCQQGHPTRCSNYDYIGSRRDGAYAESFIVPVGNLVPLPDHVPFEAGAMTDPAAIAHYAFAKTKLQPGQSVAVVGCGAIGLFAVQWARLHGASSVHAIDTDESKHAIARELGADMATHPDATQEFDRYDVVLEAAGFPSSINLASRLAGPGGEVVFIGIPTTDVTLDRATFDHLLRHEITWHGAWNSFGDPFPGASWFDTVEAFETGDLKWQPIVTHDLDLAELPATFEKIRQRELSYAKILFRP